MYFDQHTYDLRFEWGFAGIEALAPDSDAVIIVDVLSFCTCVDIGVAQGAAIYPYCGPLDELAAYAASVDAEYAAPGRQHVAGYSLSPASLQPIPAGVRLVLPSPNGSTLSLATGAVPTLAGSLRNASAVAARAQRIGSRISIIAAGERWPDRSLRPSIEDLIGAGAMLAQLSGNRSPEADLAVAAFRHAKSNLLTTVRDSGSGRELIDRGFEEDVRLAAQLDASDAAPLLIDGAYRQQGQDMSGDP